MIDKEMILRAAQRAAVKEQLLRLGWREEFRIDHLPLFRTGKIRRLKQLEEGKKIQHLVCTMSSLRGVSRVHLRARPGGSRMNGAGVMAEEVRSRTVSPEGAAPVTSLQRLLLCIVGCLSPGGAKSKCDRRGVRAGQEKMSPRVGGPVLRVFVVRLSGLTATVHVRRTDTIGAVMQMLSRRGGASEKVRSLTRAGRWLDEDKRVEEYNIQDGTTIFEAGRLRGGAQGNDHKEDSAELGDRAAGASPRTSHEAWLPSGGSERVRSIPLRACSAGAAGHPCKV